MNKSPPGDHPLYPCEHPGCTAYVDESIDPYGELCPEHFAQANEDGAPYCQYCGARKQRFCDCVIAENH